MNCYSDIKDTILYYSSSVGSLTLDNLLEMIEVCIDETKQFEKHSFKNTS